MKSLIRLLSAMKEDILEQLVDDYLQAKGYFTQHNLKFKPGVGCVGYDAPQDCVPSDIDVIGFHPRLGPPDNVWVVGCKSWQNGFEVRQILDAIDRNKKVGGKEAWRQFRELSKDKWAAAFMDAVEKATGTRRFTYVTVVTLLSGGDSAKATWTKRADFSARLEGNPIVLLSLAEMLEEVFPKLGTTVASSQFSRSLQLIKASGWQMKIVKTSKSRSLSNKA